jgi:hypothetical protein
VSTGSGGDSSGKGTNDKESPTQSPASSSPTSPTAISHPTMKTVVFSDEEPIINSGTVIFSDDEQFDAPGTQIINETLKENLKARIRKEKKLMKKVK